VQKKGLNVDTQSSKLSPTYLVPCYLQSQDGLQRAQHVKFTPKMYGKRHNNPWVKPFLESTLQGDNANVNREASDVQSSPTNS